MAPVATTSAPHGQQAYTGKASQAASQILPTLRNNEIEELLATVRCLGADLVQQFKGGHPGTCLGAAAIGLALWGDAMRFNPADAGWINRDRFVLSAGHACLLQYIYLHLTGYPTWTLDMLKKYHSPDFIGSHSHGHPEIEYEGIEVTTGPLGQGIANSVGLAMASKHLAAVYNRPGHEIVDNTIWCFTGDGCLQEGVGLEALSLGGHLRLDNLVVVYDKNTVTVDGTLDICFTQDMGATARAMGWEVIELPGDATDDVAGIVRALRAAKAVRGKPAFVILNTTIGSRSAAQGKASTHGAALGDADVRHVKLQHGRDPDSKYVVPQQVYDSFQAAVRARGAEAQAAWERSLAAYEREHPQLAAEFKQRFSGRLDIDASIFPSKNALPQEPIPTRKASGIAVKALGPNVPAFMAGSADLMESTFVNWKEQQDFQAPITGLGSYAGRQIRYGIREHAMAAIANGLAAYHKNAILPTISTFFMFFLYAAPAVRMAALQKLRVIGVATHCDIGIGEDGPTHQPIALASFYRALPELQLFRPADAEEVIGCWQYALSDKMDGVPSILALSRHALPLQQHSDRSKVARGAYPIFSTGASLDAEPQLVLIGTGGEVQTAIAAAPRIAGATGLVVRVVSMPCQALFDRQSASYRRSVIPASALVVAIEAWSAYGWARYAHAALSMSTFGFSGPQEKLFEHFGFAPENVARVVSDYAARQQRRADGSLVLPGVGDFEELLYEHQQSIEHA